jgi:hypothetical protein
MSIVPWLKRVSWLKRRRPRPYIYLPFLQSYRSSMVLHTRGAAPVDRLVDQARARVAALDADLPILYARPMAETTRGR